VAKKKQKPLTILGARKKFLKKHIKENNPVIATKFWMREIPKLSRKDFWLLKQVAEGFLLRKYSDDIIEKMMGLDRNQLIQLRTVFELLFKSMDPDKKADPDNPFTLLYDGEDYLLDAPPEKKRKKVGKVKKIGKNQKKILKVLKDYFEDGEKFKPKDVKAQMDEEMTNVNGILKVLAQKTNHVEKVGKKEYRFWE